MTGPAFGAACGAPPSPAAPAGAPVPAAAWSMARRAAAAIGPNGTSSTSGWCSGSPEETTSTNLSEEKLVPATDAAV
eukprot:1791488-Alexandrium_andersonii.AAC.1